MYCQSDEDEEEEEGGEEEDDSDLLAELQEIANEDEEEAPPTASPTATPTKPATTTKTPVQSSQVRIHTFTTLLVWRSHVCTFFIHKYFCMCYTYVQKLC